MLDALRLNVDLGEDLVTDIATKAARKIHPTVKEYGDLIEDRYQTKYCSGKCKTFYHLQNRTMFE